MIEIPKKHEELVSFASDLIEKCRVSAAQRSAYYRVLNAVAETGRPDGTKAIINKMNAHLERASAHLFSPIELKFDMDFDRVYAHEMMLKGKVFAKRVTRHWERSRMARDFGRGVYEALKYGACFMKQWCVMDHEEHPHFKHRLVMPWNFGVYREDEIDLDDQEALCETSVLTMPEVWRRICHLPHANKMYELIKSRSSSQSAGSQPNAFFHNVFSANILNTGLQAATRPMPGGIVQLNTDPNYAIMGATVAAETVQFHELWVKFEDDWVTIQMVEPDILVTVFRLTNLFIKDSQLQPYNLIQPNEVSGWLWGRSELVDLIEPQQWLASLSDDARRLMGLQIDKLLGISGDTGMTDEMYAQFRNNGWMNLGQGGKVEDLTPKFPEQLLPLIQYVEKEINELGSFPEIMQGKGEPGVRAGNHASTLLKTASPTLRDRSLIVEQQCEDCADKTASLMEAKDGSFYWYKADVPTDVEETKFILAELPPDWRVTVDSHSSSPIFMEENGQEIWLAQKSGIVTGKYVLENRPFPNKESAILDFEQREKAKAAQFDKLLQQFPEAGEKVAVKQLSPGRR